MKRFIFILAALMIIGTAHADDIIVMSEEFTDCELTEDQLGTDVQVRMVAQFEHYVSAWRIVFDLPDGVVLKKAAAGNGMKINYFEAGGNEVTYRPSVIVGENVILAASMEPAYDEYGNYMGVCHWAPGTYDDFVRVTFTIAADFAGGEINWAVEPTAGGWGDHSNDCPRNSHYDLSTNWTIFTPPPVIDNFFHMDNSNVFRGDTVLIPVQMINLESIIAFQTDIYLPEGFSIVTDEDEDPVIMPSSRLTSDHMIMAEQLNDRVHVICYTPRSKLINGNEGDLFYFEVVVPENAGGDYTIYLRNSLLTASDYSELSIPDAEALIHVNAYTPGDVNDSHSVNVTDIVFTAQYILQRNPSPFIFEAADLNWDGRITVTDIMLIVNIIMPTSTNAPMHMPAFVTSGDCMSGEDITLTAGETRRVSISLDNEMDYSAFQLDLHLPDGLTANNFQLTDRAGSHILDVEAIGDGAIRALCYLPSMTAINGHSGALLTFDVAATALVSGDITVDGIELVTANCQSVILDAFTIGVNNATAVNELTAGKTISKVDYFNLAGQQIKAPMPGINLVVTTYTDGSCTTSKVILK